MSRIIMIFIGIFCFFLASCTDENPSAIGGPPPIGGPITNQEILRTQEELKMLQHREQILQSQYDGLQSEEDGLLRERAAIERAIIQLRSQDDAKARQHRIALQQRLASLSEVERDVRRARSALVAISRDREQYEEFLLDAYRRVAASKYVSEFKNVKKRGILNWPVELIKGISATFQDESYVKRFGFSHHAIDIPTHQGTEVRAADSGRVLDIQENGYGYNTLTLQHADGMTTVYGHVSAFLVKEGEFVRNGDVIALSGGRPGSLGAGPFTTGPHLHFEVRIKGEAVDPMFFLREL